MLETTGRRLLFSTYLETGGCGQQYYSMGESFLSLSLFHTMNRTCQFPLADDNMTLRVKPRDTAAYSALCHQSLHADTSRLSLQGFVFWMMLFDAAAILK
jgi:hypothetical protein